MNPHDTRTDALVAEIAGYIAGDIIDLYRYRPEFAPFANVAEAVLAGSPAVLHAAATAHAMGVHYVALGDDPKDERAYRAAALDAFDEAVALLVRTKARREADALADIPPDVRAALDAGNY